MKNLAPYAIGLGMVLFVVHNPYQPLFEYIFLPQLGMILIIFGCLSVITGIKNWKQAIGSPLYYIPLAVIALSVALSTIGKPPNEIYAGVSISLVLPAVYIAIRTTDRTKVFGIVILSSVIASLSIVYWASITGWKPSGGFVSPTNYDIATGLIIFGVLLARPDWQWWLAIIAVIGLFFSGSAEAVFLGVFMFIIVLIRHPQRKLLIPVAAVAILLIVTIPTGIFIKVQSPNINRLLVVADSLNIKTPLVAATKETLTDSGLDYFTTGKEETTTIDKVMGFRLTHWQLSPIKPFGYGINLTHFYWGIPHNVFLIIIEQVGILAMLAWLFIAVLGARKQPYLWLGFVALGIFDHYIWTQAAPWFWAIAGVTSCKYAPVVVNQLITISQTSQSTLAAGLKK